MWAESLTAKRIKPPVLASLQAVFSTPASNLHEVREGKSSCTARGVTSDREVGAVVWQLEGRQFDPILGASKCP